MAKPLAKHRRSGHFFQVHSVWFQSPAFRDLSVYARNLLFEFLDIYQPGRNGELSISTRRAMKLISISEKPCLRAFAELVEHGFLILRNHENWTQRKAREFELTIMGMDNRQPKDLWKQWQSENPVATLPLKKKPRPYIVRQSV